MVVTLDRKRCYRLKIQKIPFTETRCQSVSLARSPDRLQPLCAGMGRAIRLHFLSFMKIVQKRLHTKHYYYLFLREPISWVGTKSTVIGLSCLFVLFAFTYAVCSRKSLCEIVKITNWFLPQPLAFRYQCICSLFFHVLLHVYLLELIESTPEIERIQ